MGELQAHMWPLTVSQLFLGSPRVPLRGSCSYIEASSEHQLTWLWKVSLLFLNQEAKVCLLHASFALHLSFWHMGSRRSLLLTECNNFTYGLITANYRQRDGFAGGQLNPTHGFSERLARVSVLCRASRWHFAPPQRTPFSKNSPSPGVFLCGEASSKWQQGMSVWLHGFSACCLNLVLREEHGEEFENTTNVSCLWMQRYPKYPSNFRTWRLTSSPVVVFVMFVESLSMSWYILWQVAVSSLPHLFCSPDPIDKSVSPRLHSRSLIYIGSITLVGTRWEGLLCAIPPADVRPRQDNGGCRRCSFLAWFTSYPWKRVPPVTEWSE